MQPAHGPRVVAAGTADAAGDAAAHHFDVLGDQWDVETQAAEALRHAGLASVGPDRRVGQLSGGEALLVAFAGLRMCSAPIVLLDEPTNNLDTRTVDHLVHALSGYRGALLIVSHDDALPERLDLTATLALDHSGALTECAQHA